MSRAALCLVLLAAAASAAFGQEPAAPAWTDASYEKFTPETFAKYEPALKTIDLAHIDYELLNAAIFFETNRIRIENKKKPFVFSAALRTAAFGHAKDMAEKDFCNHINPDDATKRTPAQRAALAGIAGCFVNENVAIAPARDYPLADRKPEIDRVKVDPGKIPPVYTYVGFARRVLEGWMFSPGHKATILNDYAPYLGCGAYYCQRHLMSDRGVKYDVDCITAAQSFAAKGGPDPKSDEKLPP